MDNDREVFFGLIVVGLFCALLGGVFVGTIMADAPPPHCDTCSCDLESIRE